MNKCIIILFLSIFLTGCISNDIEDVEAQIIQTTNDKTGFIHPSPVNKFKAEKEELIKIDKSNVDSLFEKQKVYYCYDYETLLRFMRNQIKLKAMIEEQDKIIKYYRENIK